MTDPLYEINSRMGRIEGKIDTFIHEMRDQDDRTISLEVRTRKIENRLHWYAGAGAILGSILGAIGIHIKWP